MWITICDILKKIYIIKSAISWPFIYIYLNQKIINDLGLTFILVFKFHVLSISVSIPRFKLKRWEMYKC